MSNFLLNMVTIFTGFMVQTTVPLTQHVSFQEADLDYIQVPDSADFSGLTPMTAMIFVQYDGTGGNTIRGFFNHANSTGEQRAWRMVAHPNNETFFGTFIMSLGTATPRKEYVTTGVLNDTNWHQLVFTFASDDLKLYVDGTLQGVTTINDDSILSIFDAAAPLEIGAINNGSAGHFTGGVSSAAIWDSVLSAAEISAIHAAFNPGPSGTAMNLNQDQGAYVSSANLKFWARLGDGDTVAANGFLDSSAFANHGSPFNTPTISSFP